ncbi:phosphatase 2C-like domain-containing protein [Mycena rosella]|uniref:Phosphatase 2C-like domain-containing protein n=1 Tax=Mycena rosella TaxID=1033263 RepID=A0AAD7DUY1_MYCRO|nr:phosphatase 2C-like domain-containing protein [Mycena rosella]
MEKLDLCSALAHASSSRVISGAHVLSFQPTKEPNEDRYLVEEWPLHTGLWRFFAVFDGHGAGTEAVEFVLAALPSAIKSALSTLTSEDISDARIEDVLVNCMRHVDMRIQTDFLALFPGVIDDLSQDDIHRAIRDPDSVQGHSRIEVLRARTGTTAVVALVDPTRSIHVASLGDCDAVLGTTSKKGHPKILSKRHNCTNDSEVERIRAEHPGEIECVNTETSRTLGLIAVTRAMGDTLFKIPAGYTERVAPLSLPPMHPNYDLQGLAARNITPPYLSNIAEVMHLSLLRTDVLAAPPLLIMASDGLINILSRTKRGPQISEAASSWCSAALSEATQNMAVNILWDALQPEDGENLYKSMVDGQYGRRVDDITIIVSPL